MKQKPIAHINIDARMRKEFNVERMTDLRASILSKGLLHPIVLEERGDDGLWLVAGERRLRTMQVMHDAGLEFRHDGEWVEKGCVPYVLLTDLSRAEILEAELEENMEREALTWQEQADGRRKLFELRKAKAAAEGTTYTATQLAQDLQKAGVSNSSVEQVYRDLQVSKMLDNPEVRGSKTLMEGVKAAKKATEKFLASALADVVDQTVKTNHTFIEGDSLEVLSRLDPNRYDCVLTDPPYGIGIDSSGSMVQHTHHYDDSPEYLERILERVPLQLYRITRAQAHVYWFCDLRQFGRISHELEEAGFAVYDLPIIWWKRGKAMAPDSTRWPKREYECVIYAIKGDKPTVKVAGDVISTAYGSDLQQAEKPEELFVELLSRSVMPGSQVIDPFCGSGVIFSAAEKMKCSATGIEIDPARGDLAKIRAHGL